MSQTVADTFDRVSVRSLAASAGWALQAHTDTIDCYHYRPAGSDAHHELTVFYNGVGGMVAARAGNWDHGGRFASFPVTTTLPGAFARGRYERP